MSLKLLFFDMTPVQTWKANKGRTDLRSYTRDFQKKFETKHVLKFLPGDVYALKYRTDSEVLTDKHHFTPLIVSFGRFLDESGPHLRGLNLLFLRKEQKLELLEEVYALHRLKPDQRVAPLLRIHEKWMKITPYAFKNFVERRVHCSEVIVLTEWGMIPLLHDYLFGTFNAVALNEDFQRENALPRPKMKKKKLPTGKLLSEKEELSIEMEDELLDIEYAIENATDLT